MPNIDSGRYFFTAVLPVKNLPLVEKAGMHLSPAQAIRDTLSVWATAQQGRASVKSKLNSPFSLNDRNHFVRIFLINDTIYNGRIGSDVLKDKLKPLFGISQNNLLIPQKVDQLTNPFLVFVADIDAPKGEESELDSYLDELWSEVPDKMSALFKHCEGFEDVEDPAAFRTFMRAGQIETTMSFNDYWQGKPPLVSYFKTINVAVPLLVFAAGTYLSHLYSWWWMIAVLIATLVVLVIGLNAYGRKGFPMAPDSDLRSVLKSLYLQNELIEFAVSNQGADAKQLRAAFGEFLQKNKPESLGEPTQPPGVLRVNETHDPSPIGSVYDNFLEETAHVADAAKAGKTPRRGGKRDEQSAPSQRRAPAP